MIKLVFKDPKSKQLGIVEVELGTPIPAVGDDVVIYENEQTKHEATINRRTFIFDQNERTIDFVCDLITAAPRLDEGSIGVGGESIISKAPKGVFRD